MTAESNLVVPELTDLLVISIKLSVSWNPGRRTAREERTTTCNVLICGRMKCVSISTKINSYLVANIIV
jgi:hypothetical protein